MKPNQLRATVRLISVVVSCLIICSASLFAGNDDAGIDSESGRPTKNFDPSAMCAADLTCSQILFLWENFESLTPDRQNIWRPIIKDYIPPWPRPQLVEPSPFPPFMGGNKPRTRGDDDRSPNLFNDGRSPVIKDLSNLDKVNLNDYDELLLATWDKIDKLMEAWKKELKKLFSAEWEDQERISSVLDKQWQEKINELIQGIQNQQAFVGAEATDVFVLDVVDFTNQIQAIHRLLNPPDRLHPWLKWLLYLSRVSREMLQFYQAALEGRDRIYTLASKSDGRLKIRYQGRIMDIPIFIWPDDAEGSYELVMVRDQRALASSHSSVPVAQAGSALPPQ